MVAGGVGIGSGYWRQRGSQRHLVYSGNDGSGGKGVGGVYHTAGMVDVRASAASGVSAAMATAARESEASGAIAAMAMADGYGGRLSAA